MSTQKYKPKKEGLEYPIMHISQGTLMREKIIFYARKQASSNKLSLCSPQDTLMREKLSFYARFLQTSSPYGRVGMLLNKTHNNISIFIYFIYNVIKKHIVNGTFNDNYIR